MVTTKPSPPGQKIALDWFKSQGWTPFEFQEKTWNKYNEGWNGLVNAPTGSGKTYSLFIPFALEFMADGAEEGLQAIWVTPIRALTKEIYNACTRAAAGMDIPLRIAVRTGDTPTAERAKLLRKPPHLLITTPESIHILLASKNCTQLFKKLKLVVVDEWHELLGTKRGVLVELALSRFKTLCAHLKIWGISATIGNLDQALEVLTGFTTQRRLLVISGLRKSIEVKAVLNDQVETLPWGGHLGIKLLEALVPLIDRSKAVLLFTNTRAQCEIWYQRLLDAAPHLAGLMAMHHSAISRELRDWVEDALYEGRLKVVVCTSSLDLGVDFHPVETVIQVGSPKGIARFIQRAGRSGHQPGATSRIYFVPTHALELMEVPALRRALRENYLEQRTPHIRSFDVLVQYLMTLAVGEGFYATQIWQEIITTHCFVSLTPDEWQWALDFITLGGSSLQAYHEYQKVEHRGDYYFIQDRRTALRHRLSIGTIVGDASLKIKLISGKYLGTIEEWFISQLNPGDVFWFAGQSLEFVRLKDMEAHVRRSTRKNGRIPSWQGGKMPLSSQLSEMLRAEINRYAEGNYTEPEIKYLEPIFQVQRERSFIPSASELLVEYFETTEGYHLLIYPFEGHFVHEGMAALIAKRISRTKPLNFSISMNDYGFELLADQPLELSEKNLRQWLSPDHLYTDILQSINSIEIARRQFREVARISGLVFAGYPHKPKREKHLQASAQLIFEVFREYEPDNLLYLQTMEEALHFQLEEARLRTALSRINTQRLLVATPEKITPFAFPIMVERLRERFTSEDLTTQIQKMQIQWR